MRRFLLGPLAAATLAAAVAPTGAAAALDERRCAPSGFRCATVAVPLDRANARGTVRLAVKRLPAADAPTPTALVVIVGGPGQAATPLAGELRRALRGALGGRDLVVYDQRGVGRSGPLRCRRASIRGCARELGRRRGAYTTAADVEDLEAIRAAGGYERVTLYGTSYGTKVALAYAAAHADRVERLVLDSVVTPEGPDPLRRSTFAATRRVLPALCAAGACRRPVRALAAVVRRLGARGAVARIGGRGDGARQIRVDAGDLVSLLLAGDRNPVIRAETPGAVLAARRGDLAPLGRLVARSRGVRGAALARGDGINPVRNVTTICEELPFPWRPGARLIARVRQARAAVGGVPRAQLAPFDRRTALTSSLVPTCLRWPAPIAPPPPAAALPVGIPTLLLAGEQDLRTPLEDAQAIAGRLGPTAALVTVPDVGHSVLGADPSGCASRALRAFMAGAAVAPCEASDPLVEVPVAPARSVRRVPAYRGVPGLAGRTLAATSRTVSDASRATLSSAIDGGARRVAGLHGGTAERVAAGVRLRHYSYIRGVTLSGLVPQAGGRPLRMTVGGSRAAHGRFTVAGGRIRGRLGGRRIDVATNPPAARAASARPGGAALPPFPRLARAG